MISVICRKEHERSVDSTSIYKYNNNKMNQVFKILPIALQWEILIDFVGGYVVRNNRLRRLMSGDLQEKIMEHNFELSINRYKHYGQWAEGLWVKPHVKYPLDPLSDIMLRLVLNRRSHNTKCFSSNGQQLWKDDGDPESLLPVSLSVLGRGLGLDIVVLFQTKHIGKLSYGFFNWAAQGWRITDVDDSIILQPFEKNVYPSYPYTNKKLGRPVLKMKLYNMFFHGQSCNILCKSYRK